MASIQIELDTMLDELREAGLTPEFFRSNKLVLAEERHFSKGIEIGLEQDQSIDGSELEKEIEGAPER